MVLKVLGVTFNYYITYTLCGGSLNGKKVFHTPTCLYKNVLCFKEASIKRFFREAEVVLLRLCSRSEERRVGKGC